MDRKFLIIPEFESLEESAKLAESYHAAFEYDDFYFSSIYDSKENTAERVRQYRALGRDMSMDTLHGVFMDLAVTSSDSVMQKRSRYLVEQSMDTAGELGVRGVVFHTGLIGALELPAYIDNWVEKAATFWDEITEKYAPLEIYMENTFERRPDAILRLSDRLAHRRNFKLCFDYGHAVLTPTAVSHWAEQMSVRTGHIHLNDNDRINDLHKVPGDGKIDFGECRQLLERYMPEIPILLELGGIANQRKALSYMKNL